PGGAGLARSPAAPGRPPRVVRPVAVVPPAPVEQPAPQPVAGVQPQPAPIQPVPAAVPQQDQVIARLPSLSVGEQMLDQVANTAAQTLDSIVAAVDGSRSNPQTLANPPIPTQAMPVPVQIASAAPVEVPAPV